MKGLILTAWSFQTLLFPLNHPGGLRIPDSNTQGPE